MKIKAAFFSLITFTTIFINPIEAVTLLDTSDTLNNCGEVLITPDYDNCLGFFEGNNSNQEQTLLNTLNETWGYNWTFLLNSKIESDNNWQSSFLNLESSNENYSAGSIYFKDSFLSTYSDSYDIALVFKAGNEFSLYKWDSNFTSNLITYETNLSELSHAELYVRSNLPIHDIPEPMSILGTFISGILFYLFKLK